MITRAIFTPNPEILLLARRDPKFAETLNQADILLPDGFGLTLVSLFKYRRRLRRLAGIDAAELLLRYAAETQTPVALLGGKRGSASGAARNLRKRFSGLRTTAIGEDVCFRSDGVACSDESERRIADVINTYAPEIILVGLGAPKQENWIMRHRNSLPSVRIMMTVGGAFDVWSGRLRRAPKLFRVVGLEWLWRVIQQPSRIERILRATAVFPWHTINEKPRR